MITKDFEKYFIGFDTLRKQFEETIPAIPGYPPYNLKKIDDNKYVIEMAVAGLPKRTSRLRLLTIFCVFLVKR